MAVRKIYKGSSVVNKLSYGTSAVKKVVVCDEESYGNVVYENYDTKITIVTPDGTPYKDVVVSAGGDMSNYLSAAYDWKSGEKQNTSTGLYYYNKANAFHIAAYDEFGYEVLSFDTDADNFGSDMASNNCVESGSYYRIVVTVDEVLSVPIMLTVKVLYYMSMTYMGTVFTEQYQKGSKYSQIINDSRRPANKTVTSGSWQYTYTYSHLRFDATQTTINSTDSILTSDDVEYYYNSNVTQITPPSTSPGVGVYIKNNGEWKQLMIYSSYANSYSFCTTSISFSGKDTVSNSYYTYNLILRFYVTTAVGDAYRMSMNVQAGSCAVVSSDLTIVTPSDSTNNSAEMSATIGTNQSGSHNISDMIYFRGIPNDIVGSLGIENYYKYNSSSYANITWNAANGSSGTGGGD